MKDNNVISATLPTNDYKWIVRTPWRLRLKTLEPASIFVCLRWIFCRIIVQHEMVHDRFWCYLQSKTHTFVEPRFCFWNEKCLDGFWLIIDKIGRGLLIFAMSDYLVWWRKRSLRIQGLTKLPLNHDFATPWRFLHQKIGGLRGFALF